MCFSATASFVVAGVTAAAGIATLQKANKKERFVAAIPFLFAIQQFFEGLQWLSVHPSTTSTIFAYAYLLFAFLIWPTFLPIAVYRLEPNPLRRNILKGFVAAGFLTTLSLFFLLVTEPLTIKILPAGISYLMDVSDEFIWFGAIWYLLTVCGGCFVSSRSSIRWFGLAITVSAIITWFTFFQAFTSVWCFFAAALSTMLYFMFRRR